MRKDEIQSYLENMYRDCNQPDWDGYGADAISELTYNAAAWILTAIPEPMTVVDIVTEPTGGIGIILRRINDDRTYIIDVRGLTEQKDMLESTADGKNKEGGK